MHKATHLLLILFKDQMVVLFLSKYMYMMYMSVYIYDYKYIYIYIYS